MRKKPIRLIAAILVLLLSLVALSTLITSIQIVDRDGDGLRDSVEKQIHTDPLNPDSDGDDFPDGAEYAYWLNRSTHEHRAELAPTGDVDNDGLPNILDYDSDNDGLSDGLEIKLGTDPANPDSDNDKLKDGDEIPRGMDPLNPDTNGNGILDGDETTGQSGDDLQYTLDYPPMRSLFRSGKIGKPVCRTIFNPSLQSGDVLKRWITYDSVSEDYTAYIAHPQKTALELSDVEYELRFIGVIPLGEVSTQPIPIPSVSPDANIISYSSSVPDVSFHFFKDGADNYFVTASRQLGWQTVELTIVTSANSTYFHPYDPLIPETLRVSDIPENMKLTPPLPVCDKAAMVIEDLGLTGETNVKTILGTMIRYFSNFTEGDIPSEEQEPDTYLAIAQSKHGACFERSFAFFITANAIGIPTRLVTNDCHAFVEVNIPPYGWEMINLGGLEMCTVCNPGAFDVFNMTEPPGPGEDGGSDGGSDGHQGGESEKLPSFITLTNVSSSADKNGIFLAEGVVTDALNLGIQDISVDVFLNHTKTEHGVKVGSGTTGDNGIFHIICTVPGETEVGENQVVAHAKGNKEYAGSWTDPSIEIYTNTTIALDVPSSIGLGEPLPIRGTLTDVGSLPVSGAVVKASWNGSQIGQATTDEQGSFTVTFVPSSSLGKYLVSVVYPGDRYHRGTQANNIISIKDKGTRLNINVTPLIVRRHQTLRIEGTLSSSTNETMSDRGLIVSYGDAPLENISTGTDGSFATTWQVPGSVPPSNITVAVRFPETDIFAEAYDEQSVCVQSETFLTILRPSTGTINQNSTIVLVGALTDDQNESVRNVSLMISGNGFVRNTTTDEDGRFNASILIPQSFPKGKLVFRIAFPGNSFYLPSEIQKEFLVVEVGSSYLPIIIALALLVGVIVGILILLFLKRRKQKKHYEIQRSLEEIISEALTRLQTGTDHRKTVLDCYKKMCELLLCKGIMKEEAQTPREFALIAKTYLRIPPENLYDFTKVFEKARYSSREINEKDREKAIRCLRNIVFAPVQGRRAVKTQGVSG